MHDSRTLVHSGLGPIELARVGKIDEAAARLPGLVQTPDDIERIQAKEAAAAVAEPVGRIRRIINKLLHPTDI